MFEIEAEAAPVTDMTKTHETLTIYPAGNKDTIALDIAAVVAAAVRAFILGTVTSTIFFATITSVTKSTSLCLVTNSLEITFPPDVPSLLDPGVEPAHGPCPGATQTHAQGGKDETLLLQLARYDLRVRCEALLPRP